VTDVVETAGQIRVEHPVPSGRRVDSHPDRLHRVVRGTAAPETERALQEVGLEDGFEHPSGRRHHHTIGDGRDTQRSGLGGGPRFRNVDPPQRPRAIPT
jgi:hypothetical protein